MKRESSACPHDLTYKREFSIAPSERLQQLRQEREMGRYKL